MFFERKFNYLQLFQKQRKPNFNVIHAKNVFQIAAENSNVFWAFFEFFHRMYLFLYPIYFSKIFLLKQRDKDKSIRQAWTDLLLIRIWNFERKLKIMLSLCYLLHLFLILAITCCSKFQLIRNYVFWKEIQFSITFIEIEKSKFQCFPGQKCDSNCRWR